jgi:hypothetical protein
MSAVFIFCSRVSLGYSPLQIIRNLGELGEGGLEALDDLGGEDVGTREIGAVFEAFFTRR